MYAFQPISALQIFHNFSSLSNSWYLQNKTSWLPSSPDSQISYKSQQWVFIIQLWLLRLAGIWISPKSTLSPAPLLTLNLSYQHLNSATTEHLIELLFAIFEFPSISSPTCSYIELTLPAALQWQLHNKAFSTRLKSACWVLQVGLVRSSPTIKSLGTEIVKRIVVQWRSWEFMSSYLTINFRQRDRKSFDSIPLP